MPTVSILNMAGNEVGKLDLNEAVFATEINKAAVHADVRAHLLNMRQGTQSTKTRTEVSGGGRKPWKQKGTGRARQGSTRSPQWIHGGVALGPKPRVYKISLNKKLKRLAMKSALTSKVAENEMIVIDNITVEEYKTSAIVKFLAAIGADKKSLIVTDAANEKVYKSAGNIPGVAVAPVNAICVYDILNYNYLVIDSKAVAKLEEVYSK